MEVATRCTRRISRTSKTDDIDKTVFHRPSFDNSPPGSCRTLDDLISELHSVFESDFVDVGHVSALMKSYKSDRKDWAKFSKFDRFKYTRNLVDSGNGKFNLMILCWGEGQGSSIHDHADSHCFMKMLDGELHETRFRWPDEAEARSASEDDDIPTDQLEEIDSIGLGLNEVCYINDTLGLHRVENKSHTDTAISLHLYCPPFDSCHMFDQRTGRKVQCNVTFHSKFGEKINYAPDSQKA